MKIVGGMLISPFIFYSMTLREAKLAIKGHRNQMKDNYHCNLYAVTNAVGSCFGGKDFKPLNPFDKNSSTKDENTAEYALMLKSMGVDPRDVDETEWNDNWDNITAEEKRKLLFK